MPDRAEFRHVLMTRFNLATPGRESAIRDKPGWLAERFDLFERHCLPSVAAQTTRDFDWIVYFDIATPAAFRERIDACRAIHPFTPFFTPLFDADGWPRSIRESLDIRAPWLLTTRLDNDDALACDFAERLHAAVAAAAPIRSAFNFREGFVIGDGRIYALTHRSNAFVSLLEPRDGAERTVMSVQHLDIGRRCPVVQIDGRGAWLQMVHGGNVSNKIRGRRVGPAALDGRVPPGVAGALAAATPLEIALENLVLTPVRAARDRLVDVMRGRSPASRSGGDGAGR